MHSGHRERMRERVRKNGIESLNEYEFLEFLLYLVQPRVNTNEQAHRLIEAFGSVKNVLGSDEKALAEVAGIGPVSANFLSLIPEISRRCLKEQYTTANQFHSMYELMDYVKKLYLCYREETASVILLDSSFSLIATKKLSEGNARQVYIRQQDVLKVILDYKASYVVLVHNHPSNHVEPSKEDILLTEHLQKALEMVGSTLLDHLIICPNGDFYSFAEGQRL